MAFIPIPDTVRVVLSGVVGDRRWSIGIYFSMPGFDSSDMQALLDHLEANFAPDYMTALSENATMTQITAYDMRSETGDKLTADVDIDGGVASTPTAVSAAGVISFYASGRGKWNQGRVYTTGWSEVDVDEKRIQDTALDVMVAAFQTLIDAPCPGWTWTVISRFYKGAPRAIAVWAPIVRCIWRNTTLGSQRRRLQKV
jgi:hypothetical protein